MQSLSNATSPLLASAPHLTGANAVFGELIALRLDAAQWRAAARAPTVAGGTQRSRLRGRGIDFDEVRRYQPGDDVRSIDWRVTARKGKPHTKVFREERERPVLLVIDERANMAFGSRVRFKSVAAAELAALLAWSALEQGDRVGGLIASPTGVRVHRPKRSRSTVLNVLKDISDASSYALLDSTAIPPSLATMLEQAGRIARPGALAVIVSDFHDLDASATAALRTLARHCDVVCVLIFDALEAELPPPGRYALILQQRRQMLDAGDARLRLEHHERFAARRAELTALGRTPGIGFAELPAHQSSLTLLRTQGPWTPPHR